MQLLHRIPGPIIIEETPAAVHPEMSGESISTVKTVFHRQEKGAGSALPALSVGK